MAEPAVTFSVSTTEWNKAMRELAKTTGTTFQEVFVMEAKTLVRKLIRNEWRAKPKNIERQLRARLVLDWGNGNLFNVPRDQVGAFARVPKGSKRMFRARSGRRGKYTGQKNESKPGKLIAPGGVGKYKKRAGYLASGWGRAGKALGIPMPKYITRHDLTRNGYAHLALNASPGPQMKIINKANPGRGSRQKLDLFIGWQAKNIKKTLNKGIDAAFNRVQPKIPT